MNFKRMLATMSLAVMISGSSANAAIAYHDAVYAYDSETSPTVQSNKLWNDYLGSEALYDSINRDLRDIAVQYPTATGFQCTSLLYLDAYREFNVMSDEFTRFVADFEMEVDREFNKKQQKALRDYKQLCDEREKKLASKIRQEREQRIALQRKVAEARGK